MKPSQASIYRTTERLLVFTHGVVERLPKSIPNKVVGEQLVKDLLDTLKYITLAFQVSEGKPRLECIDALILSMTSVKTIYRELLMTKGIDPRRHAQFIELADAIGAQAGAWRRKQQAIDNHVVQG